jgi:hypothetical protein
MIESYPFPISYACCQLVHCPPRSPGAYRMQGWKEQFDISFASPSVKSRSGLPDSLELALILPHVELDIRFPLLHVSQKYQAGSPRTDR